MTTLLCNFSWVLDFFVRRKSSQNWVEICKGSRCITIKLRFLRFLFFCPKWCSFFCSFISNIVPGEEPPILLKNGTEKCVWSAVADPENFGGGGFEAQNLKNSDVFTKIETDFSAEIGNSNVFFAQIQVVSIKKKKKKRSSPKLRLIFRPKSEIQTFFSPKFRWSPKKKKKKGLHQNWDWFFAGLVTFRSVGGMHPEMEPIYSKQKLIFRPKSLLLGWWGGMHPPIPPPLNPPLMKR